MLVLIVICLYQQSFIFFKNLLRSSFSKHAVSVPENHLPDFWKSKTITGDNQNRFDTTHKATYVPTDAKPADICSYVSFAYLVAVVVLNIWFVLAAVISAFLKLI